MSGTRPPAHRPGEDVFGRLRDRLTRPLPGGDAHRIAWPSDLPDRELPDGEVYREAAVLLAVVSEPDGFWIPFVERPQTMPHHPGQIGLPGGGRDEGESARDCALREADEEIGLSPGRVDLLGQLSPVAISVSGFRVEVFVGAVRGALDLAPQNREVARLLRASPEIWRDGPVAQFVRKRGDQSLTAPAYPIDDRLIWGATALMLAEFLWIWEECRPEPSETGL